MYSHHPVVPSIALKGMWIVLLSMTMKRHSVIACLNKLDWVVGCVGVGLVSSFGRMNLKIHQSDTMMALILPVPTEDSYYMMNVFGVDSTIMADENREV
jgi:hypothetical protein